MQLLGQLHCFKCYTTPMHEALNIKPLETLEPLPVFLVTEHEKVFDSFSQKPKLVENTIIHCRYEFGPNDSRNAFYLRSPIGQYRFILRLTNSGYCEHSYSLLDTKV
jgi:hypothetical protein